MDYDHDMLAEAVRSLHTQAHNEPSDSLAAERCLREPCRTVGSILDACDGDTKGMFGIEARAS